MLWSYGKVSAYSEPKNLCPFISVGKKNIPGTGARVPHLLKCDNFCFILLAEAYAQNHESWTPVIIAFNWLLDTKKGKISSGFLFTFYSVSNCCGSNKQEDQNFLKKLGIITMKYEYKCT